MFAQLKPVTMYRNAGWSLILKLYQDIRMTVAFPSAGYSAQAQLRAGETQASTLLADMDATIDGTVGTLTLSIAQADIKNITAAKGWFDVLLLPPAGDPVHLASGIIYIEDGETAHA
jgi:hypothetical protein